MSLPLSPPPSRSSSLHSLHRLRNIKTPLAPSPPASGTPPSPPSSTSSYSTEYLQLQPLKIDASSSFLISASNCETPSELQSFFSPCSSDDSDSEAEEEEDNGEQVQKHQERGYYRRLWATEAPTPAPAQPAPIPSISTALNLPKPPISLFTSSNSAPVPRKPEDNLLATLLNHDSSRLTTETRSWELHAELSYAIAPTSEVLVKFQTLHENLAALQLSRLEALSGIYSAGIDSLSPPPASTSSTILDTSSSSFSREVQFARRERDRLKVQTQKAHLRRRSVSELMALHAELETAEKKAEALEAEERRRGLEEMLNRRVEEEIGEVERFAKGLLEIAEFMRSSTAFYPKPSESNPESNTVAPETTITPPQEPERKAGRPPQSDKRRLMSPPPLLRRGTFGTPVSGVCIVDGVDVELEMF
ncbi:hypothetical protein RUND412_005465 [Rhizina undulata]